LKDTPLNEKGIDHTVRKPQKKEYDHFDEYWQGLCNYLQVKYRNTYGREEEKKE
tara:strand:+ start:10935 stop:11096 length:162 start_codon:yes stop_codon:yes gene_type:complete